jgi:hypothetical protein
MPQKVQKLLFCKKKNEIENFDDKKSRFFGEGASYFRGVQLFVTIWDEGV